MTAARSCIQDFATANPIYASATIAFYTVVNGVRTSTLATLYSSTTGSTTLANPQQLDAHGKFKQPVYHGVAVVGVITNYTVTDHETGIIFPLDSNYFGALAADPATNPITAGALEAGNYYFNTVTGKIKTYNGAAWYTPNIDAGDLISTANGLGASMVGIEDSAGNFAATNVEAALAEIFSDFAATTGSSLVGYSSGGTASTVKAQLDILYYGVANVQSPQYAGGADPTGVVDSYAAFAAALADKPIVFLSPNATYKIATQIEITGDKTITGFDGGTHAAQSSVINFTGTGNPFSAVSAEFGGVCIKNLKITGGDGSYAIRSSRPQSYFENILMEGYTGGGIELFEAGTGSQASWGCHIKNCKWVGPVSASAYRGYQIDINGGHVTLENCTAIYGAIGINIDQGEAINIIRCSLNNQSSTYSSSAAADTACIRLSGAGYKRGVFISKSYIEGFTHGVYVEKCEALRISDNYIADVGNSSNYSSVYLKDSNVNNVTIDANHFSDNGNSASSIKCEDGVNNVFILNNYISATGTSSAGITNGTSTTVFELANNIIVGGSGNKFVDASNAIQHLATAVYGQIRFPATQEPSTNANTLDDYEEGTWTTTTASAVNCSSVTVAVSTYTKIGRQVAIHVKGSFTITTGATFTSFTFTLPFSTAVDAVNGDPSTGAACINQAGIGFVVDASGGSQDVAYLAFPANQVVGTGSQAFSATLIYNAAN